MAKEKPRIAALKRKGMLTVGLTVSLTAHGCHTFPIGSRIERRYLLTRDLLLASGACSLYSSWISCKELVLAQPFLNI